MVADVDTVGVERRLDHRLRSGVPANRRQNRMPLPLRLAMCQGTAYAIVRIKSQYAY